jgi:hypothetical protein
LPQHPVDHANDQAYRLANGNHYKLTGGSSSFQAIRKIRGQELSLFFNILCTNVPGIVQSGRAGDYDQMDFLWHFLCQIKMKLNQAFNFLEFS